LRKVKIAYYVSGNELWRRSHKEKAVYRKERRRQVGLVVE